MIDYILKFASEAAARTALVGRWQNDEQGVPRWLADSSIPDLKVWRNSQDVAGTDAEGNPTVTHTFLPGYFILISLDRIIPALVNATAVQIVIDSDLVAARDKAGLIKNNLSLAILQDIRFSPVFMGRDNPWGNW